MPKALMETGHMLCWGRDPLASSHFAAAPQLRIDPDRKEWEGWNLEQITIYGGAAIEILLVPFLICLLFYRRWGVEIIHKVSFGF